RADRLRGPARHRGDDPPAAAGGLPALRVPPRARPARSRRGAPRPQGDAAPPPRLLRRPADRPAARPRMTYAEAVARLLALRGGEHAGMRPGLERIETLLEALGNPELRTPPVQAPGPTGKGPGAPRPPPSPR